MRRHSLDRRTLLTGLGATAAVLALGRAGVAAALEVATLAPGATLLTGAGGNILAIDSNAGTIVVDSGAANARDAVLKALGALPGGSVVALFNTHWHLDQVGGNAALGERGATIYAHAKTRQRLSTGYYIPSEDRYEPALAPAGRPTQSFHASASATIGGRRVDYGHLFEAHTDGDIYVHLPELNIVAVGDAVAPLTDIELDWFGGGWLGGRLDSFDKLLSLGDKNTRFVPSYGPVVDRAAVEAERALCTELFQRMVDRVRRGETADDMLRAGILEGLGRTFTDPAKLVYDLHKGFWAHHNTLSHDIV